MYFDFAPDEPKPSTSRAAIEQNARKIELQRALRMDGETEDTIRQLFEQIDGEAFRIEEYTNQLGDFDAQSEEISKLKSLLEDNNDINKNLLETIDDLNMKIATLDETLKDEKRRNLSLHADNCATQVELNLLTAKIQSVENVLAVTQKQCERAEQKVIESEWQNIQNENLIAELRSQFKCKSDEFIHFTDSYNCKVEGLKRIVRDQKAEEEKIWRKVHAMIGNCVPTKNVWIDQMLKQMNAGKAFARNGDSAALVPYCGNIINWRFILVPILS